MNRDVWEKLLFLLAVLLQTAAFTSPTSAAGEVVWLYDRHPLPHWMEQAAAADPKHREQAAAALRAFLKDDRELIEPVLLRMLCDTDRGVRVKAVQALGWGRPNFDGSYAGAKALGARLVDPDEDEEVRRWAARGLGSMGDHWCEGIGCGDSSGRSQRAPR